MSVKMNLPQDVNYIISKLLSDVIWFLYYFSLSAYSGAAIAVIGMIRELVFINREKKWAKHPIWLIFFLALSFVLSISF